MILKDRLPLVSRTHLLQQHMYNLTKLSITKTSHDLHSIWNHRQIQRLFNPLFRCTSKNHQSSVLLALCEGNPPVTVGSPHKGQVMWKMGGFSSQSASNGLWSLYDIRACTSNCRPLYSIAKVIQYKTVELWRSPRMHSHAAISKGKIPIQNWIWHYNVCLNNMETRYYLLPILFLELWQGSLKGKLKVMILNILTHFEFETEISKQTWVTLRKPWHPETEKI